jgi:membrane protease YdiL (CAAX protease family)
MPETTLPTDIPLPPQGESYWTESRRPLTSLIFVAPLLVVYEVGVLVLGTHATRNGADVWLRDGLHAVGFNQYFLLPVLTVGILLGWHYLTRQPWRFSRGVFYGMTMECVALSICLRLLGRLQGILMQTPAAGAVPGRSTVADAAGTLVGYLGAGIYEELLFRLILLSLVIAVLRWAHLTSATSMIWGALATSLLFSAAHYIGPFAYTFEWFSFVFRTLAGIFFSLLFIYRGFGIAAGAHAGYDVLVGISRLSLGS